MYSVRHLQLNWLDSEELVPPGGSYRGIVCKIISSTPAPRQPAREQKINSEAQKFDVTSAPKGILTDTLDEG